MTIKIAQKLLLSFFLLLNGADFVKLFTVVIYGVAH